MVAIFTEKVMTEAWKMIREGRDRPTEQGEISSNSRLKQERAAGEGLFGALRLTLRAALKRVVSQSPTRTLIEGSHPSPRRTGSLDISLGLCAICKMVVGEGFEPSKSVTADLQSAPFGRSGIPPWPESLCLKAGRIIPNAIRV